MTTEWCKQKVRARVETLIKRFFSAMIFISVLLGLIDFSDMVMLRSLNGCCQQNLKCYDMPLLSLGLFHERVAMTVKQI